MEIKYYRCETCGQMIAVVKKTAAPVVCCGKPMKEIIPCSTEAATEKHIPVYEVNGSTVSVSVGSVAHPMAPEHFIEWVSIQTANGNQIKFLKPGDEPKAEFVLAEGDEVKAVLAYCNLHGLWKA